MPAFTSQTMRMLSRPRLGEPSTTVTLELNDRLLLLPCNIRDAEPGFTSVENGFKMLTTGDLGDRALAWITLGRVWPRLLRKSVLRIRDGPIVHRVAKAKAMARAAKARAKGKAKAKAAPKGKAWAKGKAQAKAALKGKAKAKAAPKAVPKAAPKAAPRAEGRATAKAQAKAKAQAG